MKISEILTGAKALIDTPKKWTKHTMARDSKGIDVIAVSPEATCFCSLGAILRITYGDSTDDYSGAKRELYHDAVTAIHIHSGPVGMFNDSSEHQDVMRMFDKAIELQRKKELSHGT